jgi:transposase-like protein
MSFRPTTRCREYREGWLGRRRTYKCRTCGNKFQVDTLGPLPEKLRNCKDCVKLKEVQGGSIHRI